MNHKSDHAPYVGPGVVSGADRGSLAMERIIRSRPALEFEERASPTINRDIGDQWRQMEEYSQ